MLFVLQTEGDPILSLPSRCVCSLLSVYIRPIYSTIPPLSLSFAPISLNMVLYITQFYNGKHPDFLFSCFEESWFADQESWFSISKRWIYNNNTGRFHGWRSSVVQYERHAGVSSHIERHVFVSFSSRFRRWFRSDIWRAGRVHQPILRRARCCNGLPLHLPRATIMNFVLKTRNFVSKSHKNEEFSIKNEENCIKHDELCSRQAAGCPGSDLHQNRWILYYKWWILYLKWWILHYKWRF